MTDWNDIKEHLPEIRCEVIFKTTHPEMPKEIKGFRMPDEMSGVQFPNIPWFMGQGYFFGLNEVSHWRHKK